MKRAAPSTPVILIDELEYSLLRRFYELDIEGDGSGQQWTIKKARAWLADMQLAREGLKELYKMKEEAQSGI